MSYPIDQEDSLMITRLFLVCALCLSIVPASAETLRKRTSFWWKR